MRNKIFKITGAFMAAAVTLAMASSCGGTSGVHTHTYRDISAKAATCTEEGNIAYTECIYCKAMFVDGKEVTAADITVGKDSSNHVSLTEYEEVPATCTHTGVRAHSVCDACGTILLADGTAVTEEQLVLSVAPEGHTLISVAGVAATCVSDGVAAHYKCEECGKLFLESKEVSASELVIKASGEHSFEGDSLFCANCDAYKLLYEGKYYVVDASNNVEFKANSKGLTHTATDKQTCCDSLIAERMTFMTQIGNGNPSVKLTDGVWQVTETTGKTNNSFTRFAVSDENGAYTGRFLLTFSVTFDKDTAVDRLGMKVVDKTATVFEDVKQSLLLGSNSKEENNADRKFSAGVKYTFVYAAETTAEDQLVQLFHCFGGATLSISDIHFIPLDEAATLEQDGKATLVSFGEADSIAVTPDECTHEWAEDGHCAQCGKDV